MRMVFLLVIGFLLPLGTVFRVVQMIDFPIHEGFVEDAPGGKHEARAYRYYTESFLGEPRIWYEFSIVEQPGGREVAKEVVELRRGKNTVKHKGHGVIIWRGPTAADFAYEGQEIRLTIYGKKVKGGARTPGTIRKDLQPAPPPAPPDPELGIE